MNPQGVGPSYKKEEFQKSQAMGWQILTALKEQIKPGMNEKDGRDVYATIFKSFGVEKNWHPPKIRFGPDSIKSFKEIPDADYRLQENDIFFVDLGPIVNGYEADVGKTFILNSGLFPPTEKQILHQKVINDSEEVFALTKSAFQKDRLNGPELYMFAEIQAEQRGWTLVGDGAKGHRIGDFPHQVFHKGTLRDFKEELIPDVWILEIQLRSPDLTFGAFYEDVL